MAQWMVVGTFVVACGIGLARAECPDPAAMADARALRKMNAFVARLGVRPTGSPAHARYVGWIRRRLRAIPGVALREDVFPIDRWTEQRTKLVVAGVRIPVAGAVPYAATAAVSAPLAFVPGNQRIDAANAAGRIVVRPAPAGAIPQAAFWVPSIGWGIYDPADTIDPTAPFLGDFIAYNARVADLRNAAAAGAAGVLFVKELPREQLTGHYEPYEGTRWGVPGAFLGAKEGARVMEAAQSSASARLAVRARVRRVVTPTLRATIPGVSPQRIVIDSHTDGTNAVEDNGPIAMLAMARWLAALPTECRPRTIELAFSTAHFYQRVADPAVRDGGAEQVAQELDRDFDAGTVAAVLVLEHLGARDYAQVSADSGVRLEQTGLPAIRFIGVTPSPPLVAAVDDIVRRYDLRRTILLQGSDLPGDTVPPHCSFGGEGTPYARHLLPTIGVIAAPQTLYNPAFGLEGIDFELMRTELLAYTELVQRLGAMTPDDIAGEVLAQRVARANGAPGCPPAN